MGIFKEQDFQGERTMNIPSESSMAAQKPFTNSLRRIFNREAVCGELTTIIDGHKVNYIKAGKKGPVLLMIHGGGRDSAGEWSKEILELAKTHQVYAPDLLGFGKSARPKVKYSIEYWTTFIEKFAEQQGLEKMHIIGKSMGGGIAINFALRNKEKVDKLVLISPYGIFDKIGSPHLHHKLFLLLKIPVYSDYLMNKVYGKREFRLWVLKLFAPNPDAITEEEIRNFDKGQGRDYWRPFITFLKSEIRYNSLKSDFTKRLKDISVPTLLVCGEHDRIVAFEHAQRAHDLIPHSKLRWIRGTGHNVEEARKMEVLSGINDFLRRKE